MDRDRYKEGEAKKRNKKQQRRYDWKKDKKICFKRLVKSQGLIWTDNWKIDIKNIQITLLALPLFLNRMKLKHKV